jgi:hypothetical protein
MIHCIYYTEQQHYQTVYNFELVIQIRITCFNSMFKYLKSSINMYHPYAGL